MIPRKPTQSPLRVVVTTAALIFLAVLCLSGCSTTNKGPAYTTLYAVGYSTDTAVISYFDLVATGKLPTNSVPRVSKVYAGFQTMYRTALAVAEFNPSAPADTNLLVKASVVLRVVTEAKGGAR